MLSYMRAQRMPLAKDKSSKILWGFFPLPVCRQKKLARVQVCSGLLKYQVVFSALCDLGEASGAGWQSSHWEFPGSVLLPFCTMRCWAAPAATPARSCFALVTSGILRSFHQRNDNGNTGTVVPDPTGLQQCPQGELLQPLLRAGNTH